MMMMMMMMREYSMDMVRRRIKMDGSAGCVYRNIGGLAVKVACHPCF